MKLDCVLTAVNEKPFYLEFVPYFIKCWKKLYPNIDIKIILIANSIPENLTIYKNNIILFEPIENVLTGFTSQFIRLLYPCILNYENGIMITDIDMVPLSNKYYTENIKSYDNDKFIYYRGNIAPRNCSQWNQLAMCYNVATPKIWRDIFKINSFDDIIIKLKNVFNNNKIKDGHGNSGWSLDQQILYNEVLDWNEKTNNFIRLNDRDTKFKRFNRGNLNLKNNIKNDIKNGVYSDYHCNRPMSKYSDINWEIFDLLPS